jgi:hypothetical protein
MLRVSEESSARRGDADELDVDAANPVWLSMAGVSVEAVTVVGTSLIGVAAIVDEVAVIGTLLLKLKADGAAPAAGVVGAVPGADGTGVSMPDMVPDSGATPAAGTVAAGGGFVAVPKKLGFASTSWIFPGPLCGGADAWPAVSVA